MAIADIFQNNYIVNVQPLMNGWANWGIAMQYYPLIKKEWSTDTYEIDEPQNHILRERNQTQKTI